MSDSGEEFDRREFYRHPVDVPIQIYPQKEPYEQVQVHDLSEGGLSFQTNVYLEKGAILKIRIPYIKPRFEALCVVCWHKMSSGGGLFEVGVKFLSDESKFQLRMVEQVCQIKEYQHAQALEKRRNLTFEEAAGEWISKYADHFGHSD